MTENITIGSRGSKLALIQSNEVKTLLKAANPHLNIKIKVIRTRGDKTQDKTISETGGKGQFTDELEEGLLNQEIDLAVHSLKDLPIMIDKRLKYAGSVQREDVRDVFVSNRWNSVKDIPDGGVIATGSIRRRSQLLSVRPDIQLTNLRGNVDTRLRKLNENQWDGIIVAAAAMHRLNQYDLITEYLDPNIHIPMAGQGALGLEIERNRKDMEVVLNTVIDMETTLCCRAERLYLLEIEGDCFAPIGSWARINSGTFFLTGYSANQDGTTILTKTLQGNICDAEKLSLKLAQSMIEAGARELIIN